MSKKLLITFLFALSIVFGFSQVPGTLSYQGLLLDGSNNPVPDGPNTITFRFYNVETGGTYDATIGERTLSVQTFKGLFTAILGDGTPGNPALPSLVGSQQYWIGVTPLGGTELSPRVRLSTVPYAFRAQTVNAVDATTITSGTVPNAQLDADLQDLADGSLSGTLVGSGINGANVGTGISAANITTGTLALANGGTGAATAAAARTNLGVVIGTNVQPWDADLDDLADGSLTGSKVGTGINASNITTGTLPVSVIPSSVGSPIGSITAFAGPLANIPAGWLECNAASLTISAYPALYAAIGNIWGQADGTHFNLPDLRGYFLRGWNHGVGPDPDAASRVAQGNPGSTGSGDNVGSYQLDAIQGHYHPLAMNTGTIVNGSPGVGTSASQLALGNGTPSGNFIVSQPTNDGTNGVVRYGQETRPKNAYVIYIIKAL